MSILNPMDSETLDAYLKASAVLTEIAHGTNFSVDSCDSPTSFTISDKFASDYKVKVDLDFSSNTPIKVSTKTSSKSCVNALDAQEYILRMVTAHRLKTA